MADIYKIAQSWMSVWVHAGPSTSYPHVWVIYGRNNESNIIFVTFDDEQLYSLFTVIAPNNGEDGLNTCHLLKLSNIYIRRDK